MFHRGLLFTLYINNIVNEAIYDLLLLPDDMYICSIVDKSDESAINSNSIMDQAC